MMDVKGRFKSIDDAYKTYIGNLVAPEAIKQKPEADMTGMDKARIRTSTVLEDQGVIGHGLRYGVPAAGLTAAGMGLVAVMNGFGGPEDQPEPGTLEILQAAQALRGA